MGEASIDESEERMKDTLLKSLKDFETDYTELSNHMTKCLRESIPEMEDIEFKYIDKTDYSIPISVLREEAKKWVDFYKRNNMCPETVSWIKMF